jgi:hypothetical protein
MLSSSHASVSDWTVTVSHSDQDNVDMVSATSNTDSSRVHEYPTSKVHGIHYPLWCKEDRWQHLDQETVYKPGDIIIVSFPKCGTTWSEQAVLLLLNGGNAISLNPRFKNSYTSENKDKPGKIWIESMVEQDPSVQSRMGAEGSPLTWSEFNNAPSPRVIKSHAPASHLLGSSQRGLSGIPDFVKVIIVTRNPLDACASCYYHGFNPHKSGWSFDAWAAVWLKGCVAHGDYFAWVKGWYEQHRQHPENSLWIEYEALKLDPTAALTRLGKFLDVDLDESLVGRVQTLSSFDHMKQQTEQAGGDTLNHLRRGVVGDWKNHFNRELYDEFAQRHRDTLSFCNGFPLPNFDNDDHQEL